MATIPAPWSLRVGGWGAALVADRGPRHLPHPPRMRPTRRPLWQQVHAQMATRLKEDCTAEEEFLAEPQHRWANEASAAAGRHQEAAVGWPQDDTAAATEEAAAASVGCSSWSEG